MNAGPRNTDELDALLSDPGEAVVRTLESCAGDIVVLGAGGKMGPTLARMAARAAVRADGAGRRRVVAVSRFSSHEAESALNAAGVETVRCDLLDRDAVARLPDAPNVVFMAGQKFGTTDAPGRTWALNVEVPGYCADRYASSRIVAFSTGNVYPLVPIAGGGCRETDRPQPVGDYAKSCLAREQVFEAAAERGTRVAIVRLNYAIALTYGVLTDLAVRIVNGDPIPLAMGHVNMIWQGDANRAALELLAHAAAPARIVNVTGAEMHSVRTLATMLGARLGRAAVFAGIEADDALLSNASLMHGLLAPPVVSVDTMVDWTAAWVAGGGELLGKATKYDVRDGRF